MCLDEQNCEWARVEVSRNLVSGNLALRSKPRIFSLSSRKLSLPRVNIQVLTRTKYRHTDTTFRTQETHTYVGRLHYT